LKKYIISETHIKERSISIEEFIAMIEKLPEDEPLFCNGIRFRTQKEHWLGWLSEYNGPGAYGRKGGEGRDAKYAYNHSVCPNLLLYLALALGADTAKIKEAQQAYLRESSLMAQCGAVRKVIPWAEVYRLAWGEPNPVFGFHLLPRKKIPWSEVHPGEE
jgi:hypothetical protein